MEKNWDDEHRGIALDAAWSAFSNTLMLHGATPEEIDTIFNKAIVSISHIEGIILKTVVREEE